MKELLPRMVKKLKIDTHNVNQGQLFPLFDRIEIDFTSSGIEDEIDVQQEANSSFEALYEDLYFNTLDYFHELGRQLVNQPYKAPGGVIPYIHIEQDLYKPIKSAIKVYQWNDKPMTEPVIKRILFNQEGQFESVEMSIGNELKVTEAKTILKHSMKNTSPLLERFKQYSEVKSNYGDISYKGTVIPFFEVTEPITSEYYSGLKNQMKNIRLFLKLGIIQMKYLALLQF